MDNTTYHPDTSTHYTLLIHQDGHASFVREAPGLIVSAPTVTQRHRLMVDEATWLAVRAAYHAGQTSAGAIQQRYAHPPTPAKSSQAHEKIEENPI